MTETLPAQVPVAEKSPIGLRLIAAMKIVKGLAMAGLALGVFGLVHKNLEDLARHFVTVFRISPENHFVEMTLEKLGVVEPAQLRKLGILTAFDASIQLVEGLGLWFGAWWAEYLIVISTCLFIPTEAMGTLNRFSWLRFTILVLNLAMFAYVGQLVLRRHMARMAARKVAAAEKAKLTLPPSDL
jgi:uncharacterized membrane protein (DUF2068 family)